MLRAVAYASLGGAYTLVLLATMFFNCNVLLIASLLVVAPIFPGGHQWLLNFVARHTWRAVTWWCVWRGLDVEFYGDVGALKALEGRSKVVLCNHRSLTDSMAMALLIETFASVAFLRAFIKRALALQPIVGWFYCLLNFVSVHRNFEKDAPSIKRQLGKLASAAARDPLGQFWLLIYPEGTRLNPGKLAEAQAYARSKGLPPPRHTLMPRLKGLQVTLPMVRGEVDAVVDVTLGYPEERPDRSVCPALSTLVFGGGRRWTVQAFVRVIPIAEVPQQPKEMEEWVLALFAAKDERLEELRTTGRFPGPKLAAPPVHGLQLLGNLLLLLALAAAVAAGCAAALRYGRPLAVDLLPVFLTPAPSA
eukprot:EG_transcript_11806